MAAAPAAHATATDPLRAVPVRAPGVECGGAPGALSLRRRRAGGRATRLLDRLLGERSWRRLDLDERGSFFWEGVDGSASLERIAEAMATRFGLERAASRLAAATFAKALVERHFLALDLRAMRADPATAAGRGVAGAGAPIQAQEAGHG